MHVEGIEAYPWATWMTWDLEEHIGCLGWAGTWFGDAEARDLAVRDLHGLTEWPCYRQHPIPDLSSGHAMRTMWTAFKEWDWLPDDLKTQMEGAFERHIDDALPLSEEMHGRFETVEDILNLAESHTVLHNIPFIGTVGLALAASAISHPSSTELFNRIKIILLSMLGLREQGHTECVGYDGYIMDFAATWLGVTSEQNRVDVLSHPRFTDLFDESLWLSAPGEIVSVAEFGDVEPERMPFHLSAHARISHMSTDALLGWYLSKCRLDWMRSDGLAALHAAPVPEEWTVPAPGGMDAHHAIVLRTGWDRNDLGVAMSVSNSKMGHVQNDNGSIVIGTQDMWLITDPGYQQYMKKREREFTLGPTAHNAPVIDGQCQCRKLTERARSLEATGQGQYRARVNLTSCYPEKLGLKEVIRTVWLTGKTLVVVCDQVIGATTNLSYHWHGHAEAAWWVDSNWARLYHNGSTLWISSPQAEIQEGMVDRLPGSRGHQTLSVAIEGAQQTVWWVFVLGTELPDLCQESSGLSVNNHFFSGD